MRVGIAYRPTPRRLCENFIDQAIKTWNWIETSQTMGISLFEESITDFSLLELQAKHPYEIITQKSTKKREARMGADWEWWLTSRDFWLGLRVQAKKIDPIKLSYPGIDRITQHGRQIQLLIDHSMKSSPPRIPLYIFYNHWDVKQFDPPWLCGTYAKLPEMLGCGISHAIPVKFILDQGSDRLKDLADKMYPWSCLVCCRGFSRARRKHGKLPFRAFDFLLGAFKDYFRKEDVHWHKREKMVSQEPPEYVYKILEGMKLSEEDWSRIEVNRITVIYEKEK